MNQHENRIDVTNLCSRKLWDMLKNADWQHDTEKRAIEIELSSRSHYQEELQQLCANQGDDRASETLHTRH